MCISPATSTRRLQRKAAPVSTLTSSQVFRPPKINHQVANVAISPTGVDAFGYAPRAQQPAAAADPATHDELLDFDPFAETPDETAPAAQSEASGELLDFDPFADSSDEIDSATQSGESDGELPVFIDDFEVETVKADVVDTAASERENELAESARAFIGRMKECGDKKDIDGALEAFKQMTTEGHVPNVGVYNVLLQCCASCKEFTHAKELCKEMWRSLQRTANSKSFNCLIVGAAMDSKLSTAEFFLSSMSNAGKIPEISTCNMVLTAFANANEPDRALAVFRLIMSRSSPEPDVITFNTLITCMANAKRGAQAMCFFRDMKRAKLAPTVITYSSLITSCARCNQLNSALEIFEDMRKSGMKPNTITYNALITTCANANDVDRALVVFTEMKAAKLEPTIISYNALITACAKTSQLKRGLDVFAQMKAQNLRPTLITYSTLVTAAANDKNVVQARSLFKEMQQAGLAADAIVYNTLICACANCNKLMLAQQIFHEMKAAKLVPTMITYNTLLRGISNTGNVKLLERIMQEMVRAGLKADAHSYVAAFYTFRRAKLSTADKEAKALRCFDELRRAGCDANTYVQSGFELCVGRKKAQVYYNAHKICTQKKSSDRGNHSYKNKNAAPRV